MERFITIGEIRGNCGHKHRDAMTASICLMKDQEGCKKQGGYSDRTIIKQIKEGKNWIEVELDKMDQLLAWRQ